MLTLGSDPKEARRELEALILYLSALATADGDFDDAEVAFVRGIVRDLITRKVEAGGNGPAETQERIQRFVAFFETIIEGIRQEMADLLAESVAAADTSRAVVQGRLAQRCYEAFFFFDGPMRDALLATGDALLRTDGQLHPAEIQLRALITSALKDAPRIEVPPPDLPRRVTVRALPVLPHLPADSPFFEWFEHRYQEDPEVFRAQAEADQAQALQAWQTLHEMRAVGRGRLEGRRTVRDLADEPLFLDNFVYGFIPKPGRAYEITVLGDLHGCYGCLKAAVLQSRFLERLAAYRADPEHAPYPALVALGDYLDRGRFGFDGVLRLLLQMLVQAPQHVFLLRGNHEFFIEADGSVISGVMPAESVEPFLRFGARDLLPRWRDFFEALPVMMLLGPLVLLHGGIPRDADVKTRWKDLSSLNDPLLRYQFLWSDPGKVDVIPKALQAETARFGFGRLQAQAFLQRMGAHTLIRGHQPIMEGFRRHWEDDTLGVYTLFSAGGATNDDLPGRSGYRKSKPMGLTIRAEGGLEGDFELETWPIEWQPYGDPEWNGFYRG